jgi:UDP-N-acetylmuramate dehydrogenase
MTPACDVPLAEHCTLMVGGPARYFWRADSESSLIDALTWARTRDVGVHILGGGSNVVFADEGFDGLVIQVNIRGVAFTPGGGGVTHLAAGAGEPWDPIVAASVDRGLAGLECLSGIPGLVGGTPVQNVGAYGQDVSGTIARVTVVDRQSLECLSLPNGACGFGYRTSRFKREDQQRFVVTGVEFALVPGAPTMTYADVAAHFETSGERSPALADVRQAVLGIRRQKGMVIEPTEPANRSVGSFFVNPIVSRPQFERLARVHPQMPHYRAGADAVKIPAAWLVEHAGFPKGTRRGPVGVSSRQAQAILNLGGATALDVVQLAAEIKRGVRNAFGIAIVPEPVFVGFGASIALNELFETDSSGE